MALPTALDMSFDLNKAAELCCNVASTSYISGITASLATNASQWEPGQFSNGVTSFGANNNVFIIHNAGANLGSSQRYAYLAFSTQVPANLTKVSFSAQTNGPIPSFIIESSPRSDFSLAVKVLAQTAGTTKQWAEYSVTFDPLPMTEGTITYIRIRAANAIPDGSNYIAYNNIKFSGSVQQGAAPATTLSAQSGLNRSSGTEIQILYDFNTAKELALNVASNVPIPDVNTVVSTNASQWEPGQFNNGVTKFGPGNNVFILHNAGAANGANQKYLFITLANQKAIVLNKLEVNIGSNATGTGPSSPVVIAVEASSTADFATSVTLGSISTVSSHLALNMLLPRGTTFLRLRSTTPIPNGANYVAYDHLKLTYSVATDDWKKVGTGASYLLTVGAMLFAVDQSTGSIKRYKGVAGQWDALPGSASKYHGTDAGLYAITNDQTHVVQYNFTSSAWDVIGPAMVKLFSGRNMLHGLDSQGMVWMYMGNPNQWTNIGGPFRSVDANDHYCFGIPNDGQSVQMRPNTDTSVWTTIYAGSMAGIVASGNALYGLTGLGGIIRYSGTGTSWSNMPGGGFSRIIPQGTDLLAVSADCYAVYRLRQESVAWMQVGGPTDSLWANDRFVFGIQAGKIVLKARRDLDQTNFWSGLESAQDTVRLALDDPRPVPPPVGPKAWLFEFKTKDAFFAGYSGKVMVTLHCADGSQQRLAIPSRKGHLKEEFSRGELVVAEMDFFPTSLSFIQLQGEWHFLPDHWTVDKIWAWSLNGNVQYEFDVNKDIPNSNDEPEWVSLEPSFRRILSPGSAPIRIFVWDMSLSDRSVGHASMILSDGTYISWWPEDYDPDGLYFAGAPLVVARVFDQQYVDDYTLEEKAPDQVIAVHNLDEAAIKRWWITYRNENNTYDLAERNCSTVVYLALKAGGALGRLDTYYTQWANRLGVWTPNDIGQLARLVQVGAPQWPDDRGL